MNQEKDQEWVSRVLGTNILKAADGIPLAANPDHAVKDSAHATSLAVTATLNEDPVRAEMIRSLHPILQQALQHPFARQLLSKSEINKQPTEEDRRNIELVIDNINNAMEELSKQIQDKNALLYEGFGNSLMSTINTYQERFNACGMHSTVVIALQIFAMTTLRDEAKRPASNPLDINEIRREVIINKIISDLLGGPQEINISRPGWGEQFGLKE